MARQGRRRGSGGTPTTVTRDMQRGYREQREQAAHERIERILSVLVNREATPKYTEIDALMELEEGRRLALSAYPPQVNAAVNATLIKCKLMKLIGESATKLPAGINPLAGPIPAREDIVMQQLRDRIGDGPAMDAFVKFLNDLKEAHDGDVIEGEAEDITEQESDEDQ